MVDFHLPIVSNPYLPFFQTFHTMSGIAAKRIGFDVLLTWLQIQVLPLIDIVVWRF